MHRGGHREDGRRVVSSLKTLEAARVSGGRGRQQIRQSHGVLDVIHVLISHVKAIQLGRNILGGLIVRTGVDHSLVRPWEQKNAPLVLSQEGKTWTVLVKATSPGLQLHLGGALGLLGSSLVHNDGDLAATDGALVGVPKDRLIRHNLPTWCMETAGPMPDVLNRRPTSWSQAHNL